MVIGWLMSFSGLLVEILVPFVIGWYFLVSSELPNYMVQCLLVG